MPDVPTDRLPRAVVFDPTPVLTITVESLDGAPDLHVHAGGQGVWVARMLVELGVEAVLCAAVGGETGTVLAGLAEDEGIRVASVASPGSCGAYINDRRSGERVELVSVPPAPLGRHVLDDLYGVYLAQAVTASVSVLTGPRTPGAVRPDTYRRLSSDARALDAPVVADLSGEHLLAALEGGLTLLKVSAEELVALGWLDLHASPSDVLAAARRLRKEGAEHVVISRSEEHALALIDGEPRWVSGPRISPADHRGAGDSLTAGLTAALALGLPVEDAVRLGVAAGTATVSRHGLATATREAIDKFLGTVDLFADPSDLTPLPREEE